MMKLSFTSNWVRSHLPYPLFLLTIYPTLGFPIIMTTVIYFSCKRLPNRTLGLLFILQFKIR